LSAISNTVPALVNEVSPKLVGTKKQRLTSYDTNEVMVSFAASNQESELAFQELMKSNIEMEKEKATMEKRRFLMFLIEIKASSANGVSCLTEDAGTEWCVVVPPQWTGSAVREGQVGTFFRRRTAQHFATSSWCRR
jgi:hypothetical protein